MWTAGGKIELPDDTSSPLVHRLIDILSSFYVMAYIEATEAVGGGGTGTTLLTNFPHLPFPIYVEDILLLNHAASDVDQATTKIDFRTVDDAGVGTPASKYSMLNFSAAANILASKEIEWASVKGVGIESGALPFAIDTDEFLQLVITNNEGAAMDIGAFIKYNIFPKLISRKDNVNFPTKLGFAVIDKNRNIMDDYGSAIVNEVVRILQNFYFQPVVATGDIIHTATGTVLMPLMSTVDLVVEDITVINQQNNAIVAATTSIAAYTTDQADYSAPVTKYSVSDFSGVGDSIAAGYVGSIQDVASGGTISGSFPFVIPANQMFFIQVVNNEGVTRAFSFKVKFNPLMEYLTKNPSSNYGVQGVPEKAR